MIFRFHISCGTCSSFSQLPFQSYVVYDENKEKRNESCQKEADQTIAEPDSTAMVNSSFINLEDSDDEEMYCHDRDPFLSDTVDIKKPTFRPFVSGGFTGNHPMNNSYIKNCVEANNNVKSNMSHRPHSRVFVVKNNKATAEALGRCIENEFGSSNTNGTMGSWHTPQPAVVWHSTTSPKQVGFTAAPHKSLNKRKNFTPNRISYQSFEMMPRSQRYPLSSMENADFGTPFDGLSLNNPNHNWMAAAEHPDISFTSLLKLGNLFCCF